MDLRATLLPCKGPFGLYYAPDRTPKPEVLVPNDRLRLWFFADGSRQWLRSSLERQP